MAYYGAGSTLQIGTESAWGTPATATKAWTFLSESLKLNKTRKEEDNLIAGKSARAIEVMGQSVVGDINLLLKPADCKELFWLAYGDEATPALVSGATYSHTFTMESVTTALPSFFAIIDRHAAIYQYNGLKINSLKLDAKAQDWVRATVGLKGKGETSDTLESGLAIDTAKAFKFSAGAITVNSTSIAVVKSVTYTLENNLDDGEYFLGSGISPSEPTHQMRKNTLSMEVEYGSAAETLKGYLDTPYQVVLTFTSATEIESGQAFRFTITMPNFLITEAAPSIGGRDKLAMTVSGEALETASVEAVTVVFYDGENKKAFVV